MTSTLAWWTVIAAVGALNFFSRLSFIALFARIEMPPLVRRALRFVPAAMLAAIVVPAVVFTAPGAADFSYAIPKLVAALAAALVAWRTGSPTATMAGGMVVLWAAQWLLGPPG